ncbi:MAG: hypothetical protein A2992_09790 [Elusimicrobia bacterium RIFCSPLOWO2_01_FULL_59_12]|nr:MAG: hypothetical protein A2992_09790 [Elusimicrobia bacterium RIFCSPLOWO2_01_FULL_59_12]
MFDIIDGSYVWNAEKEQVNFQRHGIGFTEAAKAFEDPNRLIIEDLAHSRGEDRFYCIGRVQSDVITVRFTFREELIRIIGAGRWRKWRKYYEEKTKR